MKKRQRAAGTGRQSPSVFERGLLRLEVTPTDALFKVNGKHVRSEWETTLEMLEQAEKITSDAGFPTPNNAPLALKAAVGWARSIHDHCGPLSLEALAANFVTTFVAVRDDTANSKKPRQSKLEQIVNFAAAWQAFQFEVSGHHLLAFGKTKHAVGQARGAQTTASKGAQRAAIIRLAIEQQREAGKVNMTSIAAVAKTIRPAVDRECSQARPPLPVSASATSFEKLVGNVMRADRKG